MSTVTEKHVYQREGSNKIFATRNSAFADMLVEKYKIEPKSAFAILDNSLNLLQDLREYSEIDHRRLCIAKNCNGIDFCNS